MKAQIILFGLLLAGLTACSQLQLGRSDASGYGYDSSDNTPSTATEFFQQRDQQRWNNARQDLGLPADRTLTDVEVQEVEQRAELQQLEAGLQYEQEKKQYYALKPYFHNDAERIYFLKLPTREAREAWAHQNGITTDDTKVDQTTANLISNNDIGKGMTANAVKQSWGEPDIVEYAGDPMYGNERWRYNKQVSTPDGYKQETRIVYFEAGRVVGWETMQ